MTKKVIVFLANGFEEIEAIAPVDILRRAECKVEIISISDSNEVTGAHGITIIADTTIDKARSLEADALFLPGGMPGATNLNEHSGVKEAIQKQAASGKYVASICAAPLVLGGLGILTNKKATCYPGFEHTLIGANYTAGKCEVADNIITANGPGAAAILGFTLVELLVGKNTADELKKGMMFE